MKGIRPLIKQMLIMGVVLFFGVIILWAQIEPSQPSAGHAPMEVFGIGPEMFQNRMVVWIKALGEVCRTALSELGLVALAALGLWKTVSRAASDARREAKEAEIDARLDRQRHELEKTKEKVSAITTPPISTDPPIGSAQNPAVVTAPEASPLPVKETPATPPSIQSTVAPIQKTP